MKYFLFTIRDQVAEHYGPLFQAVNTGVAMRNFRQLMKDVPEYDRDAYYLCTVGAFDDESGEVLYHKPEPVIVEDDNHADV